MNDLFFSKSKSGFTRVFVLFYYDSFFVEAQKKTAYLCNIYYIHEMNEKFV